MARLCCLRFFCVGVGDDIGDALQEVAGGLDVGVFEVEELCVTAPLDELAQDVVEGAQVAVAEAYDGTVVGGWWHGVRWLESEWMSAFLSKF